MVDVVTRDIRAFSELENNDKQVDLFFFLLFGKTYTHHAFVADFIQSR